MYFERNGMTKNQQLAMYLRRWEPLAAEGGHAMPRPRRGALAFVLSIAALATLTLHPGCASVEPERTKELAEAGENGVSQQDS